MAIGALGATTRRGWVVATMLAGVGWSLAPPAYRSARRAVVTMSEAVEDDSAPSDVSDDSSTGFMAVDETDEDVWPSDVEDLESLQVTNKARDAEAVLLRLCAATSRGAYATSLERSEIDDVCRELEASNPGAPLEGRWRLAYSSEQGLYRSSPFFWGFSQLVGDKTAPLRPRNAETSSYDAAIYAVTDALPFYEVGPAYHTIRPAKFVSEVELYVKLFDALLPRAKSVMTTTASTVPSARGLTLTLEKTQVIDSSLEAIPGFSFISDLAFPTENAFRSIADALNLAPNAATVDMLCTYTSDTLRITRTDAGLLFVHVKDPNGL